MKIETRIKILQKEIEKITDTTYIAEPVIQECFEQVIEILKELIKDD